MAKEKEWRRRKTVTKGIDFSLHLCVCTYDQGQFSILPIQQSLPIHTAKEKKSQHTQTTYCINIHNTFGILYVCSMLLLNHPTVHIVATVHAEYRHTIIRTNLLCVHEYLNTHRLAGLG